jgi:hypothetical protein
MTGSNTFHIIMPESAEYKSGGLTSWVAFYFLNQGRSSIHLGFTPLNERESNSALW